MKQSKKLIWFQMLRESNAPDDKSARVIVKALQIISESGIAIEELVDGAVLSDVGIDLLLGLMISSRFQDKISIGIDSSALQDFLRLTHTGYAMEDCNEKN